MTDLSLTVGCLLAEAGGQGGLWRGTARPALPDIPGVEWLAAVDVGSLLPERRWALGRSLCPLVMPVPVEVQSLDGLPREVRTGGDTWCRVAAVTDLWEVETAWWTGASERRGTGGLAIAGGGSVTVYRDLRAGGWYRQGG